MPLKVELPDVPPLKALINGKTIYGWQKGGSTFTYQTTQLKIPILLHTEPLRYSIMACSVPQLDHVILVSKKELKIKSGHSFLL